MGCHTLLQGIFPTWGSNLSLLHCRQVLWSHPTLSNKTLCDDENALYPHCSIQQPLATLWAGTKKGLNFKAYSILTNISLDLNSHMLRDQQLPYWAALDAQPLWRGNRGKGGPVTRPQLNQSPGLLPPPSATSAPDLHGLRMSARRDDLGQGLSQIEGNKEQTSIHSGAPVGLGTQLRKLGCPRLSLQCPLWHPDQSRAGVWGHLPGS